MSEDLRRTLCIVVGVIVGVWVLSILGKFLGRNVQRIKTTKHEKIISFCQSTRTVGLNFIMLSCFLYIAINIDTLLAKVGINTVMSSSIFLPIHLFSCGICIVLDEMLSEINANFKEKEIASWLLSWLLKTSMLLFLIIYIMIPDLIFSKGFTNFLLSLGLLIFARISLTALGSSDRAASLSLNICRLIMIVLSVSDEYAEGEKILQHGNYLKESVVASLVIDSMIKSILERKKKTHDETLPPSHQAGMPSNEKLTRMGL